MPIYEYQCDNCLCKFELKQSFDDAPISTCPHCQGTVRRLLSPTPVIFKGPGFYVTDHRKAPPSEGFTPPSDIKPSTEKAKETKK